MPKQEEETDELAVGLKVYPNPSRGLVNISYSLPDESYGSLSIFSIEGRFIGYYDLQEGSHTNSFDLSNLPAGIYIYEMRVNCQYQTSGRISLLN